MEAGEIGLDFREVDINELIRLAIIQFEIVLLKEYICKCKLEKNIVML